MYGANIESMDPQVDGALRRFTRFEYQTLIERGWFEGEPIELLDGMLVTMTPQGSAHYTVSGVLMHILAQALPINLYGIAAHSPFSASEDSMPEPDLLVFDKRRTPRGIPTEALLAIEVSNTSLRKDRTVKLPIYANNGVPEYWIIVLAERTVEVYTQPRNGTYMHMDRVASDGVLRPRFDPSIEISMASLPWD